jgi:hypothetical protein
MRALLIALSCLASTAALAGPVEVTFTKPETYTDVRDNLMRRDEVLASLAEHMKRQGAKKLKANQSLEIEVLDVDLAGNIWPRSAHEVRVLRGRADWPRMKLHYTLREDGKVIVSGEEQLSDMNYMLGSLRTSTAGTPYPYEAQMIEAWFNARFASAR